MENTQNSKNEDSFAVELAKSLALSAAISAGTFVGFMAVGLGIQKVNEFKKNKEKKSQKEYDKKFEDIIKNQ